MLVEEEHQLGGHLRWGDDGRPGGPAELRARLPRPGIEVLTNSVVARPLRRQLVAVLERGRPGGGERLIKARAAALVVAPGLIERPYVFAGNDVPGVMLSTAVRRLINLYAVKPGERAVVVTANADGDACVADLKRAGVDVAHVEDLRLGGDVIRVHGRSGVRAVELADGGRVECDLVVVRRRLDRADLAAQHGRGHAACTTRQSRGSGRIRQRCPTACWSPAACSATAALDDLLAHAMRVDRGGARRGNSGGLSRDTPGSTVGRP